MLIKGQEISALIDSGSTDSFIHPRVIESHALSTIPSLKQVSMASTSHFNDRKCIFSTRKLDILGSVVEEGQISPDPKRLRPLR